MNDAAASAGPRVVRSRTRGVAAQRAKVPFLLGLFTIAICIPSEASFALGPLTLSAYRIFLIVMFFPSLLATYAKPSGRAILIDGLLILHGLWVLISFMRNHGPEMALESGGIYVIELLGPYFLVRGYLRTDREVFALTRLIAKIICVLAPLMLIESITGIHVIKQAVASVLGKSFNPIPDTRFGLQRAFGSFDHPILAGVFTASTVAMIWYSFGRTTTVLHWKRGCFIFAAAVASVASLSSGALGSMLIQFGLIAWERVLRPLTYKWWLLAGLSVVGYIFIDLLSNRSAYAVFISYLTMNPATGYARLTILDWGFHHNVLREPIFGIGRNDWIRPEWMHSPSVDNFWLFIAMSYGIPAFFTLLAATVLTMVLGRAPSSEPGRSLRLGWLVSMFALILAAITVHYWGNSFVWYSFVLGIGTLWLQRPAPARSRRRTRRRARRPGHTETPEAATLEEVDRAPF